MRGIVPGIVRGWLLERADVTVREVRREELASLRSGFLTTAGRGVVPVHAIDGRKLVLDPEVETFHTQWTALLD